VSFSLWKFDKFSFYTIAIFTGQNGFGGQGQQGQNGFVGQAGQGQNGFGSQGGQGGAGGIGND
jgi:hypothetical protein